MKLLIYLILIPLIFVTLGLYVYLYKDILFASITQQVEQTRTLVEERLATTPSTPKPTTKPSPIPLKPDNGTKGTYQIGQGVHSGPTVRQVVFDPLDAKKDQNLKILVKIESSKPLINVKGVLGEDSGSQQIDFKLVNGTKTQGEWEGNVSLESSVLYTYSLTITATDGTSSTVVVAPRS